MPRDVRLDDWSIGVARVPLAIPFGHSAQVRTASESVLLRIRSSDGYGGWGEAAPRPYVTGETVESVVAHLEAVPWHSWSLDDSLAHDVDTISCQTADFLADRPGSFAAAAAIETALLDLVCRRHGVRMVEVLGRGAEYHPPPLTLTLDSAGDPGAALAGLTRDQTDNLHLVKVKVDADVPGSIARLGAVRGALPSHIRLVADANGAWELDSALAAVDGLKRLGVAWIEEPFAARSWAALAALEDAGIRTMADESCVDESDLGRCAEAGVHSVNIRVSKCGGPLRSLSMAQRAHDLGLRVQIGVQVAEIGPLWAAGRALAAVVPFLVALEAGRQDVWFADALTTPAFTVDRRLHRASVPGLVGHGVTPADALAPYVTIPESLREEQI